MASFPRTIVPATVTPWQMPAALAADGQTGKGVRRGTMQVGRTWQETLPPFVGRSAAGRELIGFLNRVAVSGEVFTVEHFGYLTRVGTGGPGSPLVLGAGQTGSSLVTDGWTPNITGLLVIGDVIKVAGVPYALDLTAQVNSNGSGQATLQLNPPIWAGNAPADNAVITVTGVLLNARLAEIPNLGGWDQADLIAGVTLRFREAP